MASPSERIGIRSPAVDELAVGRMGQPTMAETEAARLADCVESDGPPGDHERMLRERGMTFSAFEE